MRWPTRIRLALVAAFVVLGVAVWYSGHNQRTIAADAVAKHDAAQSVFVTALEADTALDDFIDTRRLEALAPIQTLPAQMAELGSRVGDGAESAAFEIVEARVGQFELVAGQLILAVQRFDLAEATALSQVAHQAFEDYRPAHAGLAAAIDATRSRDQARASLVPIGTIGFLALVGITVFVAGERRARTERARRARIAEVTEMLQVARSEDEAFEILKRHVERGLAGSRATVLSRNNSDNRLEARTQVDPGGPLEERLADAEPYSCLAVRLARSHNGAPDDGKLIPCKVCGVSTSSTTCVPALVGGEVIGSLLVEHPRKLPETAETDLEQAVAAAAPVIANLRTLALAETRAATDALTGLANNRAVRETTKRMVAQAIRAEQPLAAIVFDLDRFKEINDTFGHDRGDDALAAVGAIAQAAVRESDFVGRWGGEEFIVLLPDTDLASALHVAEKVRAAIARVQVPGVDRAVTASLGVAVLPDQAEDAVSLVKMADRALYTAKARGRNRVETAVAGPTGPPPLSVVGGP